MRLTWPSIVFCSHSIRLSIDSEEITNQKKPKQRCTLLGLELIVALLDSRKRSVKTLSNNV